MGLKNSLGIQAIFHYPFKSYVSLERSNYFLYSLNKTNLSLYISLTFNCYHLLNTSSLYTNKGEYTTVNVTPTILILTAKYGSGHIQVAKVLATEFEKKGYSIVISDLIEESYPSISQMTQQLLIKSYIYGQTFYKWFYYGTNKINHKGLIQFSQYLGEKRLLQLINEYQPAFIVTTFPIHVAPMVIKKGRFSIPVYTVITDYCAHPYWINSLIDHYFVASEEVKKTVEKYGVNANKINISGIPIRSNFETILVDSTLYRKINLVKSKPIITIFAGAYGVLKGVKELALQLLQNPNNQVIVICGKNNELFKRLYPLVQEYPATFRLYSYVNEIHKLFSISTCLITKPGGITLTEACALKVPLILYRPIPGQELENAQYFQKNGAACITYSLSETIGITNEIIYSPNRLEKMKARLNRLYQPHASKSITDYILQQSVNANIIEGGN